MAFLQLDAQIQHGKGAACAAPQEVHGILALETEVHFLPVFHHRCSHS
jgi:hypothetical protein